MKQSSILILSFFGFLISPPAFAQENDATGEALVASADGETRAPKLKRVAVPDCPTKEVRGICIDAATKAPLAGIMLRALDNANFTAMSEDNGEFVIKVPLHTTALYVHSPQYLSLQVAIVGDAPNGLKIEMLPDVFRPMFTKETNIVATNTQSVTNTTSHSIEADAGDIMGADVHTLNRSGNPGNGAAMFIRGLNSLNANAQPLIVIDGVIQDIQQTRTSLHDGDYTNLLLNINPEDIDKVTVLKNATALYGAKGSNGVILIETKRGHSMATRIDANVGVGVSLQPRLPSMMNASQYRIYATEMLGTYPTINQYTDPTTFKFLIDDPSKYYYAMYHNDTDWTKEVYHTAMTQNYNINVQGGDDIGMYNLSLGYTDGQSTAKENGFNRLNVRFNTDISILRKLSVRFDMSYTKINRDVFDGGAPADFSAAPVSSPTFLALIKSPFLNPYTYNNVSRYFSSTLSEADDYLNMLDTDLSLGNPTAVLKNGSGINKNRVESNRFNTVIAPRFDFNKHLSLTETFSYTLDRISQRYYRPNNGMPLFLIEGIGTVQNKAMSMFSKETTICSDTRLNFDLNSKAARRSTPHSLNAFVGVRYLNFAYDNNQPEGQYANAANDKTPNISTNMDFYDATGTNDQWRSLTWYANADYNYRNRYYLQATLSMEGNSRFGKESKGVKIGGVKWGLFPSIQVGWAISNEEWFQKLVNSSTRQLVNYLLLRVGWDLSGNDDISNYAARTSFGISKYLWMATAAQLNNIGNEEISCERTSKFNVGLKASLFKNRVGIDFDYYIHRTNDLLTLKHFDNLVAGIDNYWSNGGSLSNTGFELTLSGKPVVGKSLQVELGASVGHYVNKVKSLPNNSLIYVDGQLTAQGYTSSIYGTENIATIVGQPVGVFYGYKTDGVFATDQEALAAGAVYSSSDNGGYLYLTDATGARQNFHAGDMHFVDINGDSEIGEADKTIIGDPNPDIYGNIFANVNWKNLTLYLGFNYSLGNDIYNYQRSVLEGGSNFYNQTTTMTNRWRTEGQQTDVPRISYGDPMGNSRFSDRWIEDGSYLRLKTLRLTYKVPVSLSWLQGLALWGEANNLFTVTRYVGSDLEFSANNAVLYQGIDTGNVAVGRSFTFGMRINL